MVSITNGEISEISPFIMSALSLPFAGNRELDLDRHIVEVRPMNS